MNQSPPSTNPRMVARTASYVAAKRRQGERWRRAERAAERELERFLGIREAERRWEDDPVERL
jgi:hypothetical protein